MENQKWWERKWPRRHAIAAPYGVFTMTALLTWLAAPGPWLARANLELAADMVDLAAVLYGMIAVTVEGGVRLMFWAWEKHQEVKESLREEGRKEARAALKTQEAALKAERAAMQAHLERVSRERGIPMEELLPPQEK